MLSVSASTVWLYGGIIFVGCCTCGFSLRESIDDGHGDGTTNQQQQQQCTGETCEHENGEVDNSGLDLDDKRWNKYRNEITAALNKYKPCAFANCSCFESVMNADFAPFEKDGITKDMVDLMKDKAVKYQVIGHKLYRSEKCMFPARCEGVEHFLHEIIADLPDMEFYLNPRDFPHAPKHMKKTPVLSFSKIPRQEYDILYPAWSFWAGGPAISLFPRGMGRWDLLRDELNRAADRLPWAAKESKGFFRGSRTSEQRDPLILLSRAKPQLVDAQYTKNQAYKTEKDTLYAEPATEVHFRDHCKYKYLFNFRGVAASFRLKHLFLCNSLVFHVGDDWVEFFYDALKPWVHYVPVSTSLAEVEELLEFVQANDEVARQIAERGRHFIWEHLGMDDVRCYWRTLLTRYASLQRYRVKLDKTLIYRKPGDR